MKGIRLKIALFVLLMLTVPMLSLQIRADVQPDEGNHAISSSVSRPKAATSSGRGTAEVFKVLRVSTGEVESVPATEYVCGVLAAELSDGFGSEAYKAQAVAAYTYACYKREDAARNPANRAVLGGADLSDDPAHFEAFYSKAQAQAKWGDSFAARWQKIESSVDAVRDQVLLYGGRPIAAFFFSISSGVTESSQDVWGSALPYLTEVRSPWDRSAPGYETTVTVPLADFKQKISQAAASPCFDGDPGGWFTDISRSGAGGVLRAKVCGVTLTGAKLRSLFGLRSTNFTQVWQGGNFVFTVHGSGHDVGMSQYGAAYLAAQGKSWRQILAYYYPGTAIGNYVWPQ